MTRQAIHVQLRQAVEASGFGEWELSRRANVKQALVVELLRGGSGVPVAALERLAQALDLDVILVPSEPRKRKVGAITTFVDRVVMGLAPESGAQDIEIIPNVLALSLEGTLISDANGVLARPGLFRFLTCCRPLFERMVIFTSVTESHFRRIAADLIEEGSAPSWFANLEYVHWSGANKNWTFVLDAEVNYVLLADDLESHVHQGEQVQWVGVKRFEPLVEHDDAELDRVLEVLACRIFEAESSARN